MVKVPYLWKDFKWLDFFLCWLDFGFLVWSTAPNQKNEKILVIDDLIATGGTAEAAGKLIEISGGKVAGFIFVFSACGGGATTEEAATETTEEAAPAAAAAAQDSADVAAEEAETAAEEESAGE